jgi:hypothetical protein
MASEKKKRKLGKKPVRPPGQPFRHPDGDRRHRGGASARQAVRDKRAMHERPTPPGAGEEG